MAGFPYFVVCWKGAFSFPYCHLSLRMNLRDDLDSPVFLFVESLLFLYSRTTNFRESRPSSSFFRYPSFGKFFPCFLLRFFTFFLPPGFPLLQSPSSRSSFLVHLRFFQHTALICDFPLPIPFVATFPSPLLGFDFTFQSHPLIVFFKF